MLNQLSTKSQLFAKLAMYGEEPEQFCAFKTAKQPAPELPEPQFLKQQSLEEQRINWLSNQAKEQIIIAKQNLIKREQQISMQEIQNSIKLDGLSTIDIENYLFDQQKEFTRILDRSQFIKGDLSCLDLIKEFCMKKVEIAEFPIKNPILDKYQSSLIKKLRTSELIDLIKTDIQDELRIEKQLEYNVSLDSYLKKFTTVYDMITRKTQQSNYTYEKTEKVNEKKKTEVEIIEEWVENREKYQTSEEIITDIDELILLMEFMQFVQLKELKSDSPTDPKLPNNTETEPPKESSEHQQIEPEEIPLTTPQRQFITKYIAVISQINYKVETPQLAEQLGATIYNFTQNFETEIPEFDTQYLIITNLPYNIAILTSLDEFLINLQKTQSNNTQQTLQIDLKTTAFSKIILYSFDTLTQLLQANLAKIYHVSDKKIGTNYNLYSAEQIREIHPEAKLLTEIDEIIKFQGQNQAILHEFSFDFLQNWTIFTDFKAEIYNFYKSKNVGISWKYEVFNRVVVENPVFEDVVCDLYEVEEKKNIFYHFEVENLGDLGVKLMENYCQLNGIRFNMKKLEFEAQKEAELMAMDPKKRPPAKKQEKLACVAGEFVDCLRFYVDNEQFKELVLEFKKAEIELENQVHLFEQMFFTLQIIMNTQQANDISMLQSDVQSQFSSLFESIITEYNSSLTYFNSVHAEQRKEDIIIADQLLTLNQITQTSLEQLQKLYQDIATNFKQKSENILQINKKLPAGVIQYCEQIINMYLGYEVPEDKEPSADKKGKPAAKNPFNFREISIENFNQFITIYCISLIKQMTVVAKCLYQGKIKSHQLVVLFLSNSTNLKTVYPYCQEMIKSVAAKQQKAFETQLAGMDSDLLIKNVEAAIPADGITVDKYLILIQSIFEKLPKTFTSQVFCEETNEVVNIKIQPSIAQILNNYTDKINGVFTEMTDKIKDILINYSKNVVEVIQTSLGSQENLFAGYVQVVGQVSTQIQKSFETGNYIESIAVKDTFGLVIKREKISKPSEKEETPQE